MDKPNPINKTKFNSEESEEVNNKNKTTTNNSKTKASLPFNVFNSFAPSASTSSLQQVPRPSPSTSTSSAKAKPLKPLPTAPRLPNQLIKPIPVSSRTNLNPQTKALEFGNGSDSFVRNDAQNSADDDFEGDEKGVKSERKDKGKEREIEPLKKKLGNMNVFNSFGTFNPTSTPSTLPTKSKPKSISRPLLPPTQSSSSFKVPPTFTLPPAPPRPSSSTHNLRPLQALAPLVPPPSTSTSTSPPKPLLSTSITSRGIFLLPKHDSEDEKEEEVQEMIEGGRKLLDWRPPSPSKILALKGDDDLTGVIMGEGGIFEGWSPRKKRRGGYVLDGLASLAKSTLESASTSHSLWLHEISRTLALAAIASIKTENKLSKFKLRKILKPDIRLVIHEVLRLGGIDGNGGGGGREVRYWEESKTVLARCRILIDGQEVGQDSPSKQVESDEVPDTQGLVVFSLHSNPSTTSIDPKILLQQTQALSQSTSPSKSKSHPNNTSIVRNSNLTIPTNAHDLRLIQKEVEIWCFEPWHEIILPSYSVDQGEVRSMAGGVEEQMEVEEEEGDVFWDPRPPEVVQSERERKMVKLRQKEKEEERVKKALICSRFGIVV